MFTLFVYKQIVSNLFNMFKILLIEPFYGGSHKELIDYLTNMLNRQNMPYDLVTLPATKWHWRARTSALYMSRNIPKQPYRLLFCSSVLNLAELIALRTDLREIKKILYFHENQFVYPQQNEKDRDFQYGYNTILSALVADVIVFNSNFNKRTFLENITKHIKKQPDFAVGEISDEIEPKCQVVYFPVEVPETIPMQSFEVLHIVWPHRWEHDKNPELFFSTLFKLKEIGLNFLVSVLGESFVDPMPIFAEAQRVLADNIKHFGRLKTKSEYFNVLSSAHVVVSTAEHEFFGVAMLEAVQCGCYPLAPNKLVYPEMYVSECLYNTPQQLFKKLKNLCERPYKLKSIEVSECILPLQQCRLAAINLEFSKMFSC